MYLLGKKTRRQATRPSPLERGRAKDETNMHEGRIRADYRHIHHLVFVSQDAALQCA